MDHGLAVKTAHCLLKAAPAVQPSFEILQEFGQRSAIFYADLVARFPLSQKQWQSVPADCFDLARALPAVFERSAAEAGWLVGRLAEGQRARLKAAALNLARVQLQLGVLNQPIELSGRILALCMSGPEPQGAEQEWIEEEEAWMNKMREQMAKDWWSEEEEDNDMED